VSCGVPICCASLMSVALRARRKEATVADAPRAWLDVRGAATYAGVSETTILRAARRGALRAYKLGALWRLRPVDIDAWITASTTPVLVTRRSA
jgi:excisionase family DNA binding protein